MNLDRLRASFLEQIRADAERAAAAAEEAHAARLAEAKEEARRLIAEACAAGARDAAEEGARIEAAARRQARGRVFDARRELYRELRAAALQQARSLRGDERYTVLLDRLSATARAQLGADAELEVDPAESGGVIARKGLRLVDYSLPALVERCVTELGPRVQELWQ